MGTPRFIPASIFENPRDFGRNELAVIADLSELSEVEAGWAVLQHRTACMLTRDMREREIPLEDVAEDLGESPDWLRRKLYGRAPADVGDLIGWMLVADAILPPVEGHVACQWHTRELLSTEFYSPSTLSDF